MSDNTTQILEMLRQQQESMKLIIAQQEQLLAKQDRDHSTRRTVFRASCAILIAYMLFSVMQLYMI